MVAYTELEELRKLWKGEVCIFGAGKIGRYMAYDLIKAAGFRVDFYCDNNILNGTHIADGIVVKDNQYLYDNGDNILVFLCIAPWYQEEVLAQLSINEVKNVVIMDEVDISNILDSVDKADDKIKRRYYELYDDKNFLVKSFKRKVGYDLNIEYPNTFNEKLQWLKLYNRKPEYTTMVDKYEVKGYVADKIGENYVIPTLAVYDSADAIDFAKLPEQFVLKCTHDSGSVVICRNREDFDCNEAVRKLNYKLRKNYYWIGSREWPYKNVKPRIIAECFLDDNTDNEINDYKILCFNGRVKAIFTCTERFSEEGLKVTFFDTEWKRMPFERHYPASNSEIREPQNLLLMIDLAERLSEGIPFVRVDFYEIEGRVYFGEMTFFPGGGMEEFEPLEWDYTLGEWIVL